MWVILLVLVKVFTLEKNVDILRSCDLDRNENSQRTRLRHFDVDSKESGRKTSIKVVGSEWLTRVLILILFYILYRYVKKKINEISKKLDDFHSNKIH